MKQGKTQSPNQGNGKNNASQASARQSIMHNLPSNRNHGQPTNRNANASIMKDSSKNDSPINRVSVQELKIS